MKMLGYYLGCFAIGAGCGFLGRYGVPMLAQLGACLVLVLGLKYLVFNRAG